jgi:hypothetical protein
MIAEAPAHVVNTEGALAISERRRTAVFFMEIERNQKIKDRVP